MENLKNQYKPALYEKIRDNGYNYAKIIIPELQRYITVIDIIDIGCGGGSFLSGCYEMGLDIRGIDGEHVESSLQVDKKFIEYRNLENVIESKVKYDLCTSMEVAEHIDIQYADNLIDTLCNHSDNILFSAAQVGQPGINHINCQPLEYWIEKFEARGYRHIEEVSNWIRGNDVIYNWYRKNSVFFMK